MNPMEVRRPLETEGLACKRPKKRGASVNEEEEDGKRENTEDRNIVKM